jgi:hypothetical protein
MLSPKTPRVEVIIHIDETHTTCGDQNLPFAICRTLPKPDISALFVEIKNAKRYAHPQTNRVITVMNLSISI